ncbi:KxYKxGKxW signal peptide domain-containing protein [Weissella cibaria]|uniref:KxYKxGKxW signal peptide domain-containing protein n=1 Tax=Weissella cibaria TaxID=137591 RepID=UPI00223BA4F9|nr:KxYKxGKxW signal peptide domain-containing protein [Weissella cibaria]
MVDKETNRQTKVHFKMYKDGKQWVTRGLALFAVSLMVGGPVANTLTNVKNNVAFAQTTDSSSSDSVALTSTNNVVSANQKLNADYAAWQKQEVELQKDATFNQFMFMDDVVRNAVLDGHNAAGRGDYAGVVSADAQLLHYVSIVQEALRLLKSVDPATKGYNDLFEDLHLANKHDPKAVEAHVIALGGVVNDLTNANDFDDTKAPDMAGDKTPTQSADLTDIENQIQTYYQNHSRFGIPAAVIKDLYNEAVAEETTPSKSADADEVKVLQDLFTKMKQADLAYVDSTVHAVVAQAVDDNNQATHDGVPASVKSADFKAINDAATKILAGMDTIENDALDDHYDNIHIQVNNLQQQVDDFQKKINDYKADQIHQAAQKIVDAKSDAARIGIHSSDVDDLFNQGMAEAGKPSSTNVRDTVKKLNDIAEQMKTATKQSWDDQIGAFMSDVRSVYAKATHDGVPASVKEPAYQALVAEATNQTHPDSLGLELQTLGNLLQKMIDAINAYKPIDLPAGSTAANQTAVVSDANSFFASNLMDQGRSSYGSMAQSLATSAAKDSALSQINVDAGANSGKVSDSDLAADVTNATSGIDSAANVSDVNSIVNSYESNLVSQSVATSNSIATSIANSVAASESASISASTSASIANSLVQSQIASQAESSAAQSMIDAGRSADASQEVSLASSAAESSAAQSMIESGLSAAASQESTLASSAANSAAQSMIESGRSADASQEASLASSASAKSMIESGRSADASQESTLASSAANSAAQSMIEAGRSAAMSQEASLAASASAQSLINAGRDSLIAQESQLASEAAHEKSVADFNKAKSDAVASTKAEAKSKGVANDKDVVKAIEQISKATDQKSLQNAVDQAAIAIANAVDRAKNAKSGHRDGHTTSGNNNTKGGATKNQNPEQGQQGIVNGGSNGQANPGQGHNGTKGDKNGHQKSEQGQGIVTGGSNGGSSNGGVNGNQVAGQNGGYTDGSNVAGVTNGQVAGNNAGDVVLPSLNGVSTTNVSTPTQSTTGNATAGAVAPLVNATTGTNTTGAATAGTTTGSVPAQATGATSGTTTTHNDKPTKTKTAAKTDTGTATVQGATGSAADPATRALRDSQMKHNDNSALLTSLLSLLIAAAAGFWFFLWKRRKDQEEQMDANFAGDDEALSNEVKNIKDSWK